MFERLKAAAARWCGIESHIARNRDIDQLREIISTRDRQIHELTNYAVNFDKKIQDLRDGSNEAVRVLTEERDGFMRESAEWQGRCKTLGEVMMAMKHIIEVCIYGKDPEQHWARVLANKLGTSVPPPGDTSATNAEGA